MKRTTLILMTVLMVSVLGGGNVSPSLAQTENYCLLEISGTSGRSVCDDTTIGGWTWTASATGPVIFNTRDSDTTLELTVHTFDTTLELTVHTFDSVFTEVAAAPNEVRFTAQEGTEYAIVAQSLALQAGTIVLNWRAASSCGNGGTSLVGSSDETTGLREAVFDDPDPGESAYVLAGPKASVWYWSSQGQYTDLINRMYQWRNDPQWVHAKPHTDRWDRALLSFGKTVSDASLYPMMAAEAQEYADRGWTRWIEVAKALRAIEADIPITDDAVTQSLYASTDGSVSVRTFHDADGLPRKVIDECTGNWMLIQRYDAENVDFRFYDADGNYQSGLAVFKDEGSYYYAEIDGVPVHAGKRITGILRPTGASWTGNYTLEVDMSMIRNPQPMPQEIVTFMDSLAEGGGRRGMAPGWLSRFAAILGPLGNWLSPRVAVAGGHEGIVQDTLLLGGLGMLIKGIGIAATGSVVAPALATAGAVTFTVGLFVPDIAEGLRDRCDGGSIGDGCRAALGFLAHPDALGPIGFARDMVEGVSDTIDTWVNNGRQALSSLGSFFNPSTPPQAKDEPIRRIPDDAPLETVSGAMTDGTTTVDVTGTVTPDGDFDVADDDGEVQLQLSVGGGAPVEGSFEWDGVEGEVEVDILSSGEAEEARRLAEQAARESDDTDTPDPIRSPRSETLPAHCQEETESYLEARDPAWFQCWYWVVQENDSGSWCHTAADPVAPNESITKSAERHLERVKEQNWHAEKSTIYPCLPNTRVPHEECWSCDFLQE